MSLSKNVSKLGESRDVSYQHDYTRNFSKKNLKDESFLANCSTIEGLKQVKEALNSNSDFDDILGQEINPKIHLLLKHDIFQKIPPEFYGKIQESFFGEIITQSKKESAIMKRLEDSEGLQSGIPSSRNDSIILLTWLNSIMENVLELNANDSRF